MKTHDKTLSLLSVLITGLGLMFTTPSGVQAQSYTNNYGIWAYTTTNGAITITGTTGSGGAVTIPDTINGLPVTSIGDLAFLYYTSLTNVTIPKSVTKIGDRVWYACPQLATIMVDTNNPVYSSVDGVLFDKNQATLITCPGRKTGSYTITNSVTNIGDWAFLQCNSLTSVAIPDSVTNIGNDAFEYCFSLTSVTIGNSVASIGNDAFFDCTSLTNVTIPNSVTSIGSTAFASCTSLTNVYFGGNAPRVSSDVFSGNNYATVYYLPGTTGWDQFSAATGLSTAFWFLPNPLILNFEPSFGVQSNRFGFLISWATNFLVVVEASTTLGTPTWSPISTNTLTAGSSYFSDSQWTNHSSRFYRLRTP